MKDDLMKSLLEVLALIIFLAVVSICTCYILDCIRFANIMFNILLIITITLVAMEVFKK